MAKIIDDETMENVCILAKLSLTEDEKEKAKEDMQKMLDYVDKLDELDTSSVEPMSHIFEDENVFREDVVTNGDNHEAMLANGLMLENARRVALYGKTRLVIRVPVIPTFNDSVEEIQAIARFAASLPGVNKIHLLPYHRLGQDKYEGLGRPYLMEGILPPTAEHMQMLKNAVHAVCSLDCQIGG